MTSTRRDPMREMHPRTRLVLVIFATLVVGVLGVVITGLGVREMMRAQRLSGATEVVDARAFDWSIVERRSGTDYQLHYTFEVQGVTYSATDATGRAELWQSVPEDVWSASQESGTLRVRYAPEDPWVNAPIDEAPGSMGDHIAGLVLGLVLIAGAIWMPFRARAVERARGAS